MGVDFPGPSSGPRQMLGEVGIIVVGVLIALAAEQLVQALHWRSQVSEFRKAVDYELGRNLGTYEVTMQQRPCVTRRLTELERLLADARTGTVTSLLRPIGRPYSVSQYFSAWDNKGADVTGQLPLQVRINYGEMYDELRNIDAVRVQEREVWRSLSQFDQPEPLDHADRMRLRELLSRATQLDEATRYNFTYITNLARPLGIRPIADPQDSAAQAPSEYCEPLLAAHSVEKVGRQAGTALGREVTSTGAQ